MSSLPSTPVLGLHKFDPLDPMLPSEINDNSDVADLLPVTICTSSTRPTTGLFNGRRIYETDTTRTLFRNAGGWRVESQRQFIAYNPNWNNGGGSSLVIGAGGIQEGWYKQVGDVVEFHAMLVRVAASNLGTTWYGFDWPVPPADYRQLSGSGFLNYNGGAATMTLVVRGVNSAAMVLEQTASTMAASRVSNTMPGGWAGGEIISFQGRYRAASAI